MIVLAYCIKATLCAFFFLFLYVLLLEKENMHVFKRFYLLCCLFLSMSIPLMIIDVSFISYPVEKISGLYTESGLTEAFSGNDILLQTDLVEEFVDSSRLDNSLFYLKIAYGCITFVLILRLLRNSTILIRSAKKGRNLVRFGIKIVLVKEKIIPYSFGNFIYVNEEDYANGLVSEEIIRHERAHIEQMHSLDILFVELLIAVCWFNPILYLYRGKIKQNHEFLADNAVLKGSGNITEYQNILINMINKKGSAGLASPINYSTIKKRFIMMRKETSQKKAWSRKLVLIPALLAAVCVFSSQTIGVDSLGALGAVAEENRSNEDEFVVPGKGVSNELLEEFQRITDKYMEEKIENKVKWKSMAISNADRDRLYVIFIQMNKEQQWEQWIYLRGPFTPRVCRNPNRDEWNSAKRANILWFNGKRVENSELDAYSRKDIHFFINGYIDREEGVYQSALWTKAEYEEYVQQYKDEIPLSVLLEIKPQVGYVTEKNIKKDIRHGRINN